MKKNPISEGQRWFKQAEYELGVARSLVDNQFHAAACFFTHQAAEKFLKAILYAQGQRRVFGHSISELCDQCAEYFETFAALKKQVNSLDLYYIPTRYPNGLPGGIPAEIYNDADSAAALNMAETVQAVVAQMAPELVPQADNHQEDDDVSNTD